MQHAAVFQADEEEGDVVPVAGLLLPTDIPG